MDCLQRKSEIFEHASKACIFCKIIKKEIPSDMVYENDKVCAFLDINPCNPGHTLIVPKTHCTDITEANDDEAAELMIKAKEFAPKIVKAVNADGFNLIMNTKPAAGQVIMHVHLHIVPRFKNDGLKTWPHKEISKGEMSKIKDRIVTFLKE